MVVGGEGGGDLNPDRNMSVTANRLVHKHSAMTPADERMTLQWLHVVLA